MIKESKKKSDNKIGDFGKIYKLTSLDPENNFAYIGSTTNKYMSVRMGHHKDAFRKGQNYKGIFDSNGQCHCEILQTVPRDENLNNNLRHLERYHLMNQSVECINIRKPCFYDDKEREESHKQSVKKYQKSEKGQRAMDISALNQKLKYNQINLNKWLKKDSANNLKFNTRICTNIARYEFKIKELTEKRNALIKQN
jgi:hypothetical protein